MYGVHVCSTGIDSREELQTNETLRWWLFLPCSFHRLQFNKHGILREEGFLTPNKYDPEAISLWLPLSKNVVGLDLDTAKYILANIGDHFCQLVISEKEVMSTIEPHSKINLY